MHRSALVSLACLASVAFATPTTRDMGNATSANYTGPSNARCTRQTYNITLPPYQTVGFASSIDSNPNQTVVTAGIQEFLTAPTNYSMMAVTGMNMSSGTFAISGVLCTPKAGDMHNGSVQLLVHGIGFDSSYWDFSVEPQTYSYVQAAASAGWTTFRYDRLGTGMSDKPEDGYRTVQAPTDLAILAHFAGMLRSGMVNHTSFNKVVGVGHSYGSEQLAALSGKNTSAVDALVLTGFSANMSALATFAAGGLYTRAADVVPASSASLPGSYVMTGLPQGNQFQFFYYPYFDAAVFAQARASEQPATLGVFSTMSVLGGMASEFTGPVHVVTGDRDLPFCNTACDIVPVGMNKTILQLTQPMVFPKSSNFSVYSPANTGHGVNLHLSAPQTYSEIMGWLASM